MGGRGRGGGETKLEGKIGNECEGGCGREGDRSEEKCREGKGLRPDMVGGEKWEGGVVG